MKFLGKETFKSEQILFLDNHLCVAIKPPGLVVQTDKSQKGFDEVLKEELQKRLQKPNIYLEPIHRLDKPVEGLVVFARSSKALTRLHQFQREGKIQKYYVALVSQIPQGGTHKLCDHLSHGDFRAVLDKKNGKEARLHYRPVKKNLIAIHLLTGRYHQIRAQLALRELPIIGDAKYGSDKPYQKNAIALFHHKVCIPHPITREIIVLKYLPEVIKDKLASLS